MRLKNCLLDIESEYINTPIVSIFYDLIPLIHPDLYLYNNPDFSNFYKTKIKEFKKLDGLLAISKSSAKEAIDLLKYDSTNVYNISSACNTEIFTKVSKNHSNPSVKIDQINPFLLYTGASDPRKNVRRLLEAYSQLPHELNNYSLVLANKLLIPKIKLINN